MATKKAPQLRSKPRQQPMSSQQTPGSNQLKKTMQGHKEVVSAMATLPHGRSAKVAMQDKAARAGKVGKQKTGRKSY
jgi:hypothetical protein